MTPRAHNRMVGILHGLVGALVLTGLAVAALLEGGRRPADAAQRLAWVLFVLPLPLLQLLTAYGVYTVKRWGRTLALLSCALYVFVFPLGTLLAAYTWWALYGESGRQLYDRSAPARTDER
jgi:multisubunit Na+/H+ antiporter MnhB subunit